MCHKLMVLAVMVIFAVSADATITASGTETWGLHQPEPAHGTGGGWGTLPQSGIPYYNFRLMVHVTDGPDPGDPDDWVAAGIDLVLTGPVHFYWDPLGGCPPDPGLFPGFPDAEYDTYYTSPGDWPNLPYTGGIVGLAGFDRPTELNMDWFDTIDTGNGDFYIASITVVPDDPLDPRFTQPGYWSGQGLLQYAAANTGGQLFDYPFTIPPIPEPGGLALLLLVALAVFRRR